MNKMILHIEKTLFLMAFICSSGIVMAQKPIIKSIDKTSGAAGEVVTINGSNFGTDILKLAVYFGAAKAKLVSVSDQLIEANVPAGATYSPIAVTNLVSGLTSYANQAFLPSFNGKHGFDVTSLPVQTDFYAESGLYDLCSCDFDGDNKVDIVTANNNANLVSVFNNTSTSSAISFSKTSISLGTRSLHVKCGDLNGDGKPDLVISEGDVLTGTSDRIFVIQNMSSGVGNFSFGSAKAIKLTGRKPIRLEIADLDKDGRPEIVFTDQTINNVSILVNQSTLSAISFLSTPIDVTIPEAVSTDGLAIGDLDGDELPEIVTSQFQTNSSNVFIVKNKSTPGNVSFNTSATKLIIGNSVKRIRIGDLDGDSKADIAVTQVLGSGISIFLNLNQGSLSFSSPFGVGTDAGPSGLDFGDLDGDGKTDIVVASILNTSKSLTLLHNESTPGNLSFVKKKIATTTVNRHVIIGDLNGDSKPDIAFTSVDDVTLGASSKLSVFMNKNCMIPKILSTDPLNICIGATKRLLSTESGGATYVWTNTTTNAVVGSNNPYFDIPTTGTSTNKYTITFNPQAGGLSCPTASNEITVSVTPGVATPPTFSSPTTPVCIGSALILSVVDAGYQYKWSGPNSYTGTGATAIPSITSFQAINAGRYYLDVIAAGGCTAQQSSIVVQAIDPTDFKISYSGSEVFCSGTKLLAVSPTPSGATYKWYKNLTIISAATSSTYSAAESGDYYAEVTVQGCDPIKTDVPKIILATTPVPKFSAPATACVGQDVNFTNESTSDSQTTPQYTWTFGDTQTSSEQSPKHRYTTASTFNIKLSVSYKGGVCLAETPMKQIVIEGAPLMSITNPEGKYTFCDGDDLLLQVVGTFNSYLWSTGETTSSITVQKAGDYAVEVKYKSCTLNDEQHVTSAKPEVTISADPSAINEGESTQLMATGLLNYSWSPVDVLSNPFLPNPAALPVVSTTFTVTGKDENGCTGEASIEVKVKGGVITKKIFPANFFSPNGEGPNETWKVGKIEDYPQCNVVIYDEKGVKVFSAKPYNNDWDGTFNGKKLPDGVYYYVIKCEGEETMPKTGSITLLR